MTVVYASKTGHALKKYRDATTPRLLTWKAEVTDTLAGEANYSWVRRHTFKMPEGASNAAVMRRAKREAGYSAVRGRTENYGDSFAFRPWGQCVVMFVNLEN